MSHVSTLGPVALMVARTIRDQLASARNAGVSPEIEAIFQDIDGHLDTLTKAANSALTDLEGRYESQVVAEEQERSRQADRT